MPYFQVPDGPRLALTVAGPQAGPVVLFFHGGGQTRHAWGRAVEALGARGWRAIAVDLRGHGDSDRAERYHATDFARDIRALLEAQTAPPVVVGASLGGLAAMLANAGEGASPDTAREISRALVLVDIAPRQNVEGVNRILDFMEANRDGFDSLDAAADAVAAYQPQRAQRSDASGLRKNLRQREDGRWYWHWDPKVLSDFRRVRDQARDEQTLYQAAEGLRQPVLLLRGTMSDVVDEEIVREFQQRMPQARTADVGGAGHMVAGDRNDMFIAAIVDFLESVEPACVVGAAPGGDAGSRG